jgi:hypothetical protein
MGLFLRLDEYVEDFPAGTPKRLITLLREIVSRVRIAIDLQNDIREIRTTCGVLLTLGEWLRYLDNAHTAESPQGLVQLLERLQEKVYAEGCVLLSPHTDYNYTIFDLLPWLRRLVDGLFDKNQSEAIFDRFRGGIRVVGFPRMERENTLAHAIFGHEFGHPIAATVLADYQASDKYLKDVADLRKEIKVRFKEDLKRYSKGEDRLEREMVIYKQICEIHDRAFVELVSDSVGAYIFGLSALFASAEVLVLIGLDSPPEPPEYYPPGRYRLRHIYGLVEPQLKALRAIRYPKDVRMVGTSVATFLDYVESTIKANNDRGVIKKSLSVDVAYKWVAKSLPEALTKARGHCHDQCFDAKLLRREIPEAVERLHLEIPPSEIGLYPNDQAVDWRSALLAGWLYRIFVTSSQDREKQEKQLVATQRLTLKGIEDSLLREAYTEWTSRKGAA